MGLIRTLVARAYKINNTWLGLHEDITKLIFFFVICLFLLVHRRYNIKEVNLLITVYSIYTAYN